MEHEKENLTANKSENAELVKNDRPSSIGLIVASLIFSAALIYSASVGSPRALRGTTNYSEAQKSELEEKVLPPAGVLLPVRWGDLGVKMVAAGVIDAKKFEELYLQRNGELGAEAKRMLSGSNNGNLKITKDNAGLFLNLLWALGLGNKSSILEQGPMRDPKYGGTDNFASTGGWTLAVGDAMGHYAKHDLVKLTPQQEALVERVAKSIYRPCCNNPTYFPDCNHGMAMLGLLELIASQGVSENQMYKAALAANSYWFPDTYVTIAEYLKMKGLDWDRVDPKGILGQDFSSASGYRQILTRIQPAQGRSGGGCGV